MLKCGPGMFRKISWNQQAIKWHFIRHSFRLFFVGLNWRRVLVYQISEPVSFLAIAVPSNHDGIALRFHFRQRTPTSVHAH
jgi:hypothetical protein